MQILHDVDLYRYNTMRLHSYADIIYSPENLAELMSIVRGFKEDNTNFHILSNGSNIIFAEKVSTPIINLMKLDERIERLPNGQIKVGCSVKIMKLINELKKWELGGIEYLASVPTSIGGAVYMNAGRGKKFNKSISDYISEIEYLDTDNFTIRRLSDLSGYSYRTSPFQKNNNVILSVIFRFKEQSKTETERLVKERLEHSCKYLSADKPSCGSVFNRVNPIIIRLFKGVRVGGAIFSKKTPNWISNVDNATASDVIRLVRRVENVHKLLCLPCRREIRFFE